MRNYAPARWHRYLASKLEAVERGEIQRLMVWCPPRHGKSELTSRRFPAWYLGRNPNHNVILTSYGASLAEDLSADIREAVSNPFFGEVFGGTSLRPDTRARAKWKLAGYRGGLMAAGVEGALTGKGADLLIIDDPVKNDKEANSSARRDALKEWYSSTAFTRLEPTGRVIIIQTRWNRDDLSGWLEEQARQGFGDEWVVVNLPAIADEAEDWEEFGIREAGVPLWPEKYDLEALEKIRRVIGEYWFSALYQQRPRPASGNVLDSRLFLGVARESLPPLVKLCRFWDLAFSERDGADRAAGALCAVDGSGRFYVLDMISYNGAWPKLLKRIQATAEEDGLGVHVVIESNGTQLGYYQQAHDLIRGRIVRAGIPDGNKTMRASLWGSRLEDGIIHAVKGPWFPDFARECDDFPKGKHDDRIDAVSGGWAYLVGARVLSGSV